MNRIEEADYSELLEVSTHSVKPKKKRPPSKSGARKKKRRTPPPELPPKWKKALQKLMDLLFYLVVLAIISGALLFAANKDSNKSLFGYRFYTVKTNSMAPQKDSPSGGFYAGDVIFVKLTPYKQAKEGDIVTFLVGDDAYLTHRLKEKLTELNGKKGEYMITQGDANNSPDPPVDGERLIGKVDFVLPYAGTVFQFVRTHMIVCLVFICSLFGFVWVIRYYLAQPTIPQKKKKKGKKKKKAPRRY